MYFFPLLGEREFKAQNEVLIVGEYRFLPSLFQIELSVAGEFRFFASAPYPTHKIYHSQNLFTWLSLCHAPHTRNDN